MLAFANRIDWVIARLGKAISWATLLMVLLGAANALLNARGASAMYKTARSQTPYAGSALGSTPTSLCAP